MRNERKDMTMFNTRNLTAVVLGFMSVCMTERIAHADVIYYSQGMRDAWFADAGSIGSVETISFTEHPEGPLAMQYEPSHGLTFTTSGVLTINESALAFPNDGWGMVSNFGVVELLFDRPMTAIAADFPGGFNIELFDDRGLIESTNFGGSGFGNFNGLISTIPFNRVRLFDHDGTFSIDDLHFVAQVIPAPGAVAVFLLGAVLGRRRRRIDG